MTEAMGGRTEARLVDPAWSLDDEMPVACLTLDDAGMVVAGNRVAARLFEVEERALVGKDFVAWFDAGAARSHLQRCLALGELATDELACGRLPGRVFQATSTPVRSGDGFVGCRTVLTDVSAYKQREDSLREALRVRERFLSVVSHDLRGPLNAIMMGSEILLQTTPDPERRRHGRKQLEVIRRAVDRMLPLLGDLVDLSSMEAGQLAIRVAEHRVADLVDAAVELVASSAELKGLRLHRLVDERCGTTSCDRERVLQILLNLLGNAIRFTPEKGEVTLAVEQRRTCVEYSVHDGGVGMTKEELERAFDPYWRAQPPGRSSAGLGLAIARSIVELHGGRMRATSSAGKGSTFSFTIPSGPRLGPRARRK